MRSGVNQSIKPIETSYAGHRFRSRLEARWAVFFDALRIKWEYEPQGFHFASGRRYLPDFWLPEHHRWVEVKGSDDNLDLELLIEACTPGSGLPRDPDGTPYTDDNRNGPKLTILGPIPNLTRGASDLIHCHSTIWFHKGDYMRTWTVIAGLSTRMLEVGRFGPLEPDLFAADSGERRVTSKGMTETLLATLRAPREETKDSEAAYTAARSARFEHGETPAKLTPPGARPADLARAELARLGRRTGAP